MGTNWGVLGIEPTKDTEVIAKAYKEMLKKTNPEDDAEGFMKLRAAYEAAMEYAKAEENQNAADESDEEKTPLDKWGASLAEIYNDFQKRINTDCWRQLFSDEICNSIESSEDAFDCLFKFLMDHCYLPHDVWQLIDEKYDIQNRYDELCEKYPKDFMDFVAMTSIKREESLPYRMFVPGTNADECVRLIGIYGRAIGSRGEEALECIMEAESLSERHPYVEAFKRSLMVETGKDTDGKAMAELEEYYQEHQDDATIRNILIGTLSNSGNYKKCEDLCRKLIEEGNSDSSIQNFLANSLIGEGRLEEAFDLVNDVMKKSLNSIEKMAMFNYLRTYIADKIMEDVSVVENTGDSEYYKKMVWYAMSSSDEKKEKAIEYAERINSDDIDIFDYNNIMAAVYTESKQYDKAFECTEKLIDHIKTHNTGEDAALMNRLPGIYCSQISSLFMRKEFEKTEEYIEKALKEMPDNSLIKITAVKARLCMENYEGAAKIAESMIRTNSLDYVAWYFMGQAALGMWDMRTAFDAGTRLIQLESNAKEGYMLQLRVLELCKQYDDMLDVLNYMKEKEIADSEDQQYFEAVLMQEKDGKVKEATDIYLRLFDSIKSKEDSYDKPFYADSLKSRLVNLSNEKIRILRCEGKGDEAAELTIKTCESLDIPLIDSPILAIYKQFKRWDDAEALLDSLDDSYETEIVYQKALLEINKGNADKAKELYKKLVDANALSKFDSIHDDFLRINGDLKGQKDYWKDIVKAREKEGSSSYYSYSALAFACKRCGDWLNSRKYANLAIKELKEYIANEPESEPMYRCALVRMYAVLGKFDMASEELQKTRKCKLCSSCEYSECKDSYIFEMTMEILRGNYERAHELARYGMERWPDDVDFFCHECEMNSLGV